MPDRASSKDNPKIDLRIDLESGKVTYKGDIFYLHGKHSVTMLEMLRTEFPDIVRTKDLFSDIPPSCLYKTRDRLTEQLRSHRLTIRKHIRVGLQLKESEHTTGQSRACRLEDSSPQVEIEDERPLFTAVPRMGKGGIFALSVDGIIFNSAAELLFGSVDQARVQACVAIYKSSIEDLAFALVYGSKLTSKWRPQSEVASDLKVKLDELPYEPAQELIARLPPGLYGKDREEERFRYGRVLEEDGGRRIVGEYIKSLAKAISTRGPRELCRQWLQREAEVYLGSHPSLFAETRDPLRFGKKYYNSPFVAEVPRLLGKDALDTLVSFVPRTPSGAGKGARRYSAFARRQFVLVNVLTHLTTMYEYEQIAENSSVHRLPFIFRGSIKMQWHTDHRNERKLKTLLVRSALNEALIQASDSTDRESLIERLLWIREDQDFVRVRTRLDSLSGLTREDRPQEVKELLSELGSIQPNRSSAFERVGIDRNTLVGPSTYNKVGHANPEEYMRRLEDYFPELKRPKILR